MKTFAKQDASMVVRQVAALTAALLIAGAGGGCSMFRTSTSESETATQTHLAGGETAPEEGAEAPEGRPVEGTIAAAPPKGDPYQASVVAPRVDMFGEFDGMERPPVTPGGPAGFQQHTFVDEGYDGDIATDPAGKHLLFSSTRHSTRSDIYVQRVDGLAVTQITNDAADDAFPVFSPDGKSIAFCSNRSGNWDIYVMDADGKNIVQVTSGPAQEIHPSFSADGQRLVYASMGGRSSQWELWIVNLGSLEKRMVGFGLFPTWSPAKGKDVIAYQRARQRGSRWFSLWTLDLIDGEAKNVTEVAVSSNAAIVSPAWSPDGTRLAFSTVVDPSSGPGHRAGQQDVWTINADGSNRLRLTDGNGVNATPYWSADGRVYFVSDRSGKDSIWSAPADTGVLATVKANIPDEGHKKTEIGSTDTGEAHK